MNKLQHLQYLNFRRPSRYADNITAIQAKPSLDLNFASNKSLMDNVTGNNLVTFTRASGGTYVDSTGTLRRATTNLTLHSQTLNNPIWVLTGTGATITATTDIAAPDGSMTAWTFTTSGASAVLQNAQVLTAGISYTGSFWIRRRSGTGTVNIRVGDNVNTPLTGVTSTWQRFSFTSIPSTTTVRIGIGLSGIADSVDLWGAQLEQSSTVGEYIPTTSTINSAPRFDHNPTTGESLGLLVEEQRTNAYVYSIKMDQSPWGTGRASLITNTATAPDGTVTASFLKEDTTASNSHYLAAFTTPSFVSGNVYTQSIFAKASTRSRLQMSLPAAAFSTEQRVLFDVSAGTATLQSGSSTFSILPFGNGWYRCSITATATSTTSASVIAAFLDNNLSYVYTGDGSSGLYIWGAQLEAGAFPTSYIPTTTATVTRSADIASITGTNFSSWYNQSEGTLYHDGLIFGIPPSGTDYRRIVAVTGSNINTDEISIYRRSSDGLIGGAITTSGTGFFDEGFLSKPINTVFKAAIAYKTNDTAFGFDGKASATDTTVTLPAATALQIGQAIRFQSMPNVIIRRLTYFPQRISNANLQRITQ